MLTAAENIADAESFACDVLIVGAGAVGMAMAVDLARRGRSVTVLEAGPGAVSAQSQGYFEKARSVGRKLEGLYIGRFRALGGTTNFWGGQLVPFDPIVFGPRDWVDARAAWPITREELDPYYGRVLDLLGVSSARMSDDEVKTRLKIAPPAPPEALSFFFTRWMPEPNVATLFRGEIETSPNLRVVVGAPVVALAPGATPGAVAGAEVVDGRGRRLRFRGGEIVLANGTIEIARLLSLPYCDGSKTPWRGNPWLGRGFMDHVDFVAGEATPIDKKRFHDLFDNGVVEGVKYTPKLKLSDVTQTREKLLNVACHFLFNSSMADDLVNAKIFVRGLLRGRLSGSPLDALRRLRTLATVGAPMILRYLRHRRIYNFTDGGIQLRVTAEQRMVVESGLRLLPEQDDLGMPIAEIDWRVDGMEIETVARFAEIVRDYLAAAGLAETKLDARLVDRSPEMLATLDDANHHMGMARMADDPSDGVVDRNLKTHGADNLHVAGAAVYPSTGFANPTFTAMALGLRLTDRLAAQARA
ncbi:FAD-dependent oxidoreductase [Methylocella sp.]|uniref:FAD-dependent oxidoreductase n=1 Tax=Methylocella sp. TaxID=1978226 RepID=UPI00378451F6